MSWLDHIEDRVNELLVALERIADALERIAPKEQTPVPPVLDLTSHQDSDPAKERP